MKTLTQLAGRPKEQKYFTNEFAARYWGTYGKEKPFLRDDGSVGVDKTRGFHSRPAKKQSLRNANRANVKRGRQLLKRVMIEEIEDS